MAIDETHHSGMSGNDEGGHTEFVPTLDWSDEDLRTHLAQRWQQKSSSTLRVIGRVSRAEGKNFGFLNELHHPDSGNRLPSAVASPGASMSVFVPPSELRTYLKTGQVDGFAVAELDLSPLIERTSRADPLACMVRPNTLEPLSHIPESWWHIQDIQSAPLPFIVTKVRDAVEDLVRRETAQAGEKLQAMREEVEATVDRKAVLDDEYRRIEVEIGQRTDRIAALEAEFAQRTSTLQNKFGELESFFRERGERMVALNLVDRADIEKVLPSQTTFDARNGYHFGKELEGSLERLASYIQAFLWRKGVLFTRAQLLDFITLLRTNDLIVLAGDSGSGKTSLVKSFAQAVGGRCTVVPVKPNWTGSDDLLGYYNPIERRYHPSQFLLALLEAAREPQIPHFICLDEMNLARVEYYFADFLSLLETRSQAPWIHLYSSTEERQAIVDNKIFLTLEEEARKRAGLGDDASFCEILMNDQANLELRRLAGFQEADTLLNYHAKIRRSLSGMIDIPAGFRFPENVWIIGAINVDETTHYLSPKILDRAHVMRFRNPVLMDWDEVESELQAFDLDLQLPMNILSTDIGSRAEYPAFDQSDAQVKLLISLSRDYLDPLGIEFGMRAIRQSLNYILKAAEAGIGTIVALNNVVVHKILPKIILDVEKASSNGQKRRDLLIGLRDSLAQTLVQLDRSQVTESAVESLDELISRSESNNGIANFWTR
ncbi:McrB family protein [Pseudomonas sp. Choline-02u-1]|uniref:McrB family protein n=1 Tax=Pseudomonas sp. Choline-02u-1 TaxID=2058307 RepID=UPI0021154D27|nr:AAA family ATPase [Pseudomonas sp. Choline-02u-1]